jgi:hypothetical protein
MAKLLLCIVTAMIVVGVGRRSSGADAPADRPGLALKFDVSDEQATLIVAFDYLRTADARPRFEGVRRYTYTIPVDAPKPTRVGWDKANKLESVILGGRKYVYTPAMVDRTENGSIGISRVKDPDGAYRIQGVYHYAEQLFVIDAVVKPGDPVLLYEDLPKERSR